MKYEHQGSGVATRVGSEGVNNLGRWVRWATASVALVASIGGCGASSASEETASGVSLDTVSEALRCESPGDPNSGNCPWRQPWSKLIPHDNIDITHNWAPTLFSSNAGWLVASVDTANKYRMLQFNSVSGTGATWATYGSTRTWKSRPAITAKENSTVTGQPGFVVAGKLLSTDSNNNRIMVSQGVMAQAQFNMGSPTFETGFAPIDTSGAGVYSSGGLPALATYDNGSGGGNLLLTFMGTDLRTVYAHTHLMPYATTGSWSSRIQGPALPTGWTAVYAPAVVRLGLTYEIVVHARKNTTDGLFYIHFYNDNVNPPKFTNQFGTPVTAWSQYAGALGTIDDDPWVTSSPDVGLTVYFRRGTQIMETNLPGVGTVLPVRPNTGISFGSSPSATGDRFYDQGTHVVVARSTSNQLYWTESNQDSVLGP